MQSSFPCSHHHGSTRGFSFQQNTNSICSYPPLLGSSTKLPRLLFPLSTKPIHSTPPPIQLSLRPHFPSQSPSPATNKPFRIPSLTLFPRTEIVNKKAFRLPPLLCGISSNTNSTTGARSFREWIELIGEAISTAFPIWVALGCLLGLIKPSSFSWVQPKWTVLGITLSMLGMGMTLTFDDLRAALAMPKELFSGFVLQYSISNWWLLGHFLLALLEDI